VAVRKPLVVINGGLSEVPAADTIEVNWTGVLAKPVAIVALAALVPIANTIAYFDSTTTAALAVQSAYARTLIDDPDAPTARGTLGLGTAAVENIGTSGNVVPKLNSGNVWSASQVIDAPGPLTLTWTDDGTIAVALVFDRISSTPAAADRTGTFQMKGRNSAAASVIYGSFTGNIGSPTAGAETTYFNFNGLIAGTSLELLRIGDGIWVPSATGGLKGTGTINATALYENNVAISSKYLLDSLVTTYAKTLLDDVDAPTARGTLGLGTAAVVNTGTGGATVPLQNTSPSFTGTSFSHIRQDNGAGALVLGNLNDVVGGDIYQILFRALDSTGVIFDYASQRAVIIDPTNGVESGGFEWRTAVAGTLTRRLHLRQGLYSDGVTGNDKGLGTANFATYYENNIALSAKYVGTASISAYGATLIDDVDAPTARGTLGLGTAATQNIGIGGAVVPLLNASNLSFSGNDAVFSGAADAQGSLAVYSGSSLTAPYRIFAVYRDSPLDDARRVFEILRTSTNAVLAHGSVVWTAATLPVSAYGLTLVDDADALTARGTLGLGTAAVQNIGTTGANVPLLNTSVIFSGAAFTLSRVDLGAFDLNIRRSDVSGTIGTIFFQGNDSLGQNTNYAGLRGTIVSSVDGSEQGRLELRSATAGNLVSRFNIDLGMYAVGVVGGDKGVNSFNAVTIYQNNNQVLDALDVTTYTRTLLDDIDASTARGTLGLGTAAVQNIGTSGSNVPLLSGNNIFSSDMEIRKGAASTGSFTLGGQMASVNSVVGQFIFTGWDDTGAITSYGMVRGWCIDPTNGSEDGRVEVRTLINGNSTPCLYVTSGVHTPAVADMGINTVNATTLYEAGQTLTAKYGRLANQNVFTAGNRFPALNSIILALNDDTAGSITLLSPGGSLILVDTRGSPVTTSGPRGMWFAATNVSILTSVAHIADANLEFTTGALTGTTGTDGKFTMSVHGTGIYFENRTGAARTVDVCIIGGY